MSGNNKNNKGNKYGPNKSTSDNARSWLNSGGGSSQTNNQNASKSTKRISAVSSWSTPTVSSSVSSIRDSSSSSSGRVSSASSSYNYSSSSVSSVQVPKGNKLNKQEARKQNLVGFLGNVNQAAKSSKNPIVSEHLKGISKSLRKANTDEAKNHARLINNELKKKEYQEDRKGMAPSQQERGGNNRARQVVNHMETNMNVDRLKNQQNQTSSSKKEGKRRDDYKAHQQQPPKRQ